LGPWFTSSDRITGLGSAAGKPFFTAGWLGLGDETRLSGRAAHTASSRDQRQFRRCDDSRRRVADGGDGIKYSHSGGKTSAGVSVSGFWIAEHCFLGDIRLAKDLDAIGVDLMKLGAWPVGCGFGVESVKVVDEDAGLAVDDAL
jgi:hypothetical protein